MNDKKIEELHTQVRELRDTLRKYGEQIEDAKGAALCETSAEVVGGLEEAFDHYLQKSEKAWQ